MIIIICSDAALLVLIVVCRITTQQQIHVSMTLLTAPSCNNQSAYLQGMNSFRWEFSSIVTDIIIPIFTDEKTESQGS